VGEVVPSQHWVSCGDVAVLQSENAQPANRRCRNRQCRNRFPPRRERLRFPAGKGFPTGQWLTASRRSCARKDSAARIESPRDCSSLSLMHRLGLGAVRELDDECPPTCRRGSAGTVERRGLNARSDSRPRRWLLRCQLGRVGAYPPTGCSVSSRFGAVTLVRSINRGRQFFSLHCAIHFQISNSSLSPSL